MSEEADGALDKIKSEERKVTLMKAETGLADSAPKRLTFREITFAVAFVPTVL